MNSARKRNIFTPAPDSSSSEQFESLLERPGIRIERILSSGQATPEGEWYDQPDDEWVLLLSGSAGLLVEGESELIQLLPGDHLLLPAHCRHRVEWTDPVITTVWLACHVNKQEDTYC